MAPRTSVSTPSWRQTSRSVGPIRTPWRFPKPPQDTIPSAAARRAALPRRFDEQADKPVPQPRGPPCPAAERHPVSTAPLSRLHSLGPRPPDLCVRSAGHSAEDTRADGQRTNLNQVSPRAVDAWPYFVGPGSGRQVLQTWPIARPQFSVRTSQRPMPRVTPSPAKRRPVNRTRAAAGEGWGEGHTDTASFRLYDSTLSCSTLSAPGRRVRAKWPPPSCRIDCSTLSDLLSRPQAAA
jgi:hypothetical protein